MVQDESWVDRNEYPFQPHYLDLEAGRMHYVDEGQGEPIVMVHGTPTWSFLYRHLIKGLSPHYRCIAPDHLGFGLSDKPVGWEGTPEAHARNLTALIDRLELRDITLVVHDFGGPIGLSYAVERPKNVRRLVIFNTWMWSLKGDKMYERGAALFGSRLGKLLYLRFGFSARVILPSVYANKSKLTKAIHQQYLRALPTPQARYGTWVLARHLIASSDWFARLWQRNAAIRAKPALVLWGLKDTAFPPHTLDRWRSALLDAQIVTYDDAGHFVQEEKGTELVPVVKYFLEHGPSQFGQQIVGEAGNFKR